MILNPRITFNISLAGWSRKSSNQQVKRNMVLWVSKSIGLRKPTIVVARLSNRPVELTIANHAFGNQLFLSLATNLSINIEEDVLNNFEVMHGFKELFQS